MQKKLTTMLTTKHKLGLKKIFSFHHPSFLLAVLWFMRLKRALFHEKPTTVTLEFKKFTSLNLHVQ